MRTSAIAFAGLLATGALAGCQCGAQTIPPCAGRSCPCLVQSDCPDGFDCVEDVCVEHRDWPDAGGAAPSSVVDLTGPAPRLLREGALSARDLHLEAAPPAPRGEAPRLP